jgi:Pyruvate/2-oxoacid:ferredoxin oxidoreductase delta subunit/predicted transcriptional regulator
MSKTPYKQLAERLDALPNGYPPTEDGAELRLLEYLFTPEEAELAAQLRMTAESHNEIGERLGRDPQEVRKILKGMVRKGLIGRGRMEGGLGFQLIPFAIGFYEYQFDKIDEEFAKLFEDYYQQAFSKVLAVGPQLTRVVPVNETIRNDMEVAPYESVVGMVESFNAWGVQECLCRNQKALIGDPCDHPVEVCMSLHRRPGIFDNHPSVRALTKEEALETLKIAADAGLVHQVGNNLEGGSESLWFICNCCTCSCGILRGMSELGIANVVARSPFVNEVDELVCNGCEDCLPYCQFNALSMDDMLAVVDSISCVGCGVCVPACSVEAMTLVRRPEEEIVPIPASEEVWMEERARERGIDLDVVK